MSKLSETKSRIMDRPAAKNGRWGQEGATLLLALLFFLLCAVCGSVILASATASAGRIAGLGKNRQKYQSVEAAARLLENGLHNAAVLVQETEKITVTVEHDEKTNEETGDTTEETYTTTTYQFSGPDFLNADTGNAEDAESAVAAAFSTNNGSNADLSLLEQILTDADISAYNEKGEMYQKAGTIVISDKEDESSENAEEQLSNCQSVWRTDFLRGDSSKSVKRHFTMQLSGISAENSSSIETASSVDVELQLYGDGTLELRLSNGNSGDAASDSTEKDNDDADKYYMLLRGAAEVKSQSKSERTDQKFGEDDADSDESSETLVTKKTSIRWGDFTITKNAVEAGNEQDTGSLTQTSHAEENSEENSDHE